MKPFCPYCSTDVSGMDADALIAHKLACRDRYYDASDALRAEPKITAIVTTRACDILELLDNREDYCAACGVVLERKSKRLTIIKAPRATMERLASEFADRDDAGWDQPTAWRTSARKAAATIRVTLAASPVS